VAGELEGRTIAFLAAEGVEQVEPTVEELAEGRYGRPRRRVGGAA